MIAVRYNPQPRRRTRHANYVLVTLLVMDLLFLGAYKALAGFVDPVEKPFIASHQPAVSERWVEVRQPTLAFGPDGRPAWVAAPGERYQVLHQESGWTLAIRQGDSPAQPVWLAQDARVRLHQR
jgi:hypothetical protein